MEDKAIVHDFDNSSGGKFFTQGVIMLLAVVAVAGIATGYLVSLGKSASSSAPQTQNPTSSSQVKTGDTYGAADNSTFKDTAEGTLKAGGIDGEGQYHLERPGGDSQSVYMTSSVIDLSLFVGHKVKVWGQTNTAQKAGWLMDVGKLQVE